MKKISITIAAAVVIGIFSFTTNTTSVNSDSDLDLSRVIAVNTANAEWVAFGCAIGGTYCKGVTNCKSVILSNKKCSG